MCLNDKLSQFFIKNKKYHYCHCCNSVFLDNDDYLSLEQQKQRYLLHNNTLENIGYKAYLQEFIDKMIHYSINSGDFLDYGSGPNPCLIQIIQENFDNKYKFSSICGWDPLFLESEINKKQFDIISCLEVAEHFSEPRKSFDHISSLLRQNAFLVIKTNFLPELSLVELQKFFNKWWYKEDPTHVCFYTKKGMELCAKISNLHRQDCPEKDILVFTKISSKTLA